VLGVANRRPPKKPAAGSDKAASMSDLATSSDVGSAKSKSASKSGSNSGKGRSLLEEELIDPELEQIKKKVAQRAQFNPLLPPNYVPPSRGSNWVLWVSIAVAVVVVGILVVALH